MPTIREVALRAGVSTTTVSHVINNTRFVSPEARQRVLEAMAELNYRPNVLARSLRRGETRTLGLILPDSANPFFAEIARAIEDSAFKAGYNVILGNSESELEKEQVYVDVLVKKQVDGLIFVACGDHSPSLQPLLDENLPLVVVDRRLSDLEVDTVLTDNFQGGWTATQYLIELGHRCVACITGPSNLSPSAERVVGYRRALEESGLAIDESLICRGDFHPRSGYVAAKELLNHQPPPTAFFVCNDMMAIGALRALSEAGLRVPEDCSVVGFDDIELASYVTPPLTTIRQDKTGLAETAVQLLLERIATPGLPSRTHVLPTQLVERQSTRRVQ
ncbi:MAG: LacI family DNA-binding transcriptional regulator [Anaerolineales bacterium]|nr:LacI family transcriptional regulator [Anaerolineales bacterium]MCS7247678.1 LacI family transcriptional regulator [Anaerolineales bacterium]MDW8161488.1 LacI family DNA-binding transcriptional regulator [Anaerolineales bacterium]MDW8447050.1 LacI family DNA-binding transcriptional regulator [Anaerolineales bacterium]